MFDKPIFILAKKTAFVLFFCTVALMITARVLNYRLMIDSQPEHSMYYRVGIGHIHHIDEFHRGDLIVFIPGHGEMAGMFMDRMTTKMVGGVPGDKLTVKDGVFSINGKEYGKMEILDRAVKYMHRDAKSFDREEIVPPGKLLVVGTEKVSFDSRYWGFLYQDSVIGDIAPIY